MSYGNYGTQPSATNYGIGGSYFGTLQSGLNSVMNPTTTPFPPDSYTPNVFGSPPPTYMTPPPGGSYQVPPQQTYYRAPSVGRGSGVNYTPETSKASIDNANDDLEQQRREAINQGRPDVLNQINEREDQLHAAQGQIDSLNTGDSSH